MSSELKACPFCGGPARQDDEGFAFCTCDCVYVSCGTEAWNRRSPSPAVKALVEACRDLQAFRNGADGASLGNTTLLGPLWLALAAVEREIEERP